MKNKKILAILTISAIVSAAATGCSFGGDEPEEQVVVTETPAPEATATPTPEPTIAPDVQDSTYTSSNGAVSIKLPDATWSNKADEADMLSFESPEPDPSWTGRRGHVFCYASGYAGSGCGIRAGF